MDLKTRITMILVALVFAVTSAGNQRACMVLNTKGNNTVALGQKSSQMRTLQVLPSGAELTIPSGATLRLSYFQSGVKEEITGPCTVKTKEQQSEKLSGSGKIKVQSRRGAKTRLNESENLRRMGGALQANADKTPDDLIAMHEPIYSTTRGGVVLNGTNTNLSTDLNTGSGNGTGTKVLNNKTKFQTNRKPKNPSPPPQTTLSLHYKTAPIRMNEFSPVYPNAGAVPEVQWSGSSKETLRLFKDGQTVLDQKVSGQSFKIPKKHLLAGSAYKVQLGPKESREFRILSNIERSDYSKALRSLKTAERKDLKARWSEIIFLQSDLGLLSSAESSALAASRRFPKDSGFLSALGRIQIRLGKKEQALENWRKASKLEEKRP